MGRNSGKGEQGWAWGDFGGRRKDSGFPLTTGGKDREGCGNDRGAGGKDGGDRRK